MNDVPYLARLSIQALLLTAKNPRRDAADDPELAGLAASMGSEAAATLAQHPVVEALEGGQYRVIAGERRIRAARLAGWQTIPCVIRPRLDPLEAHRLRVVENLHRKELHPLDQAIALKLAWYSTNAEAMGFGGQAAEILDREQAASKTLGELETFLAENAFVPSHPPVSWDAALDRLGVAMDRERRKKLLQVLGVAPAVQEQLRQLDMTEASLRALAKLEPEAQARLVEEMAEDPALTRKVRRISHAVRTHAYGVEEAIAEARGEWPDKAPHASLVQAEADDPEPPPGALPAETGVQYLPDEDLAEQVVQFMDAAHAVKTALEQLRTWAGDNALSALPAPWGQYAQDTLLTLSTSLKNWEAQES